MKHFSLNLEAVSPLAIRSDHAPGGAASASYISGTTLMGGLATVFRLAHENNTEHFEELFLSGQVQYPNLYPASFASNLPVYPAPKTAQTCKRFPGFRNQGEDEPGHGVRDSLLDWAMFELGSKAVEKDGKAIDTTTLLKPLHDHKVCPKCQKPMDHFAGYYRRSNEKNGPMMATRADTRLQTHTGINRDTGTVQEGILYNRQVFEEHSRFWGMVKLPEQLVPAFESFVNDVGESGLVHIGTGRTRGLGKVKLSAKPLEDEQSQFDRFKQRLEAFKETLLERARETFNSSHSQPELKPFYFVLTLHSPAILRDELLRYRGTIDVKTMEKLLGWPADTLELLYQAASTRRVTGWNELWGTPRMNEYAIDTGSVFLFASTIEPDNKLWQAMFRLEEEGIGRRRAEGFGRVCFSDPFHLEVEL